MTPLVVALEVHDEATYRAYRTHVATLMARHGVTVRAEYAISATLHSAAPQDQVNRLVIFDFPDESTRSAFFSDPDYVAVKPMLLASTTRVARLVEG